MRSQREQAHGRDGEWERSSTTAAPRRATMAFVRTHPQEP